MHSNISLAGHAKPAQVLGLSNLKQHNPINTLDIFYQAVNRGELIIFGQKIEKSLLIPMQVEYIYKFDGTKPFVKIYSELKYDVSIAQHPEIKLRGISAVLNNSGHIIETSAHVVPVD